MTKRTVLLSFLVSVLCLCDLVYSECGDLDKDACSKLHSLMPDMCNDKCIADVCRRTCDNCPIRCYQCDKTFYPEECKAKKECNESQVCVAAQELSVDFLPVYVSDCMDIKTCLDIFGEIVTGVKNPTLRRNFKRDYMLNGSCCDRDFCNFHDPSFTPTEPPTALLKPKPTAIDYGSTCETADMDADVCKNLTMLDNTLCDKPCFAQKICPATCQTCRTCYRCTDVGDTGDCHKTHVCNLNQRCIQIHTLDDNFMPVFKLGCANERICKIYFGTSGSSAQPVGKRQLGREGKCCDSDYCNGPAPSNLTASSPDSTPIVSATSPAISKASVPVTSAVIGMTTVKPTVMVTDMTTEDMTTVPIQASTPDPGPDTRCADINQQCVNHPVFCNASGQSGIDYAAQNCPSTCNLCDRYWEIQNSTQTSTTTPIPCVDELPGCDKYGPLFCADNSPSTRSFVIKFCALTCHFCNEYFKYHGH